jgi:hypothetical protein
MRTNNMTKVLVGSVLLAASTLGCSETSDNPLGPGGLEGPLHNQTIGAGSRSDTTAVSGATSAGGQTIGAGSRSDTTAVSDALQGGQTIGAGG